MYDYANILFTGKKCNSQCYECIGRRPELSQLPHNLDQFPLLNIDGLIAQINQFKIRDAAITGTNVDPQLYRHEEKLISYLRERVLPATNLSLHTNGLLAEKKIDVLNQYDKASISFPSFNPETYEKVTHRKQPNLQKIVENVKIPLKLSMLITPFNSGEIDDYLAQAANLGIQRVVIRKLKGREEEFPLENQPCFYGKEPRRTIFGWPIYEIRGVEVTVCGFDKSTARGLFLFSDGTIKEHLVE